MMRKKLAILLAISLCFGAGACNSKSDPTATTKESSQAGDSYTGIINGVDITSGVVEGLVDEQISDLVIPDEGTGIRAGAFRNKAITSVTISDNVTMIGPSAFEGCTKLKKITIPKSVTKIGANAFKGCTSLETVVIEASLDSLGEDCFAQCESLKTVILSGNILSIEKGAFAGCSSLNALTLSDALQVIGEEAFSDCISLTSLSFPASVRSIEDNAFSGCRNLSGIFFQEGLETIGDNAFSGCLELSRIDLPKTLTFIGYNAFELTKWLAAQRQINSMIIVNDILLDGQGCWDQVTVPNGIKVIASGAFENNMAVSKLTLPESVTIIGDNAFRGCSNLIGLNIPKQLAEIGDSAFEKCYKLQQFYMPDSVLVLGSDAFRDCKSLEDLVISKNLTRIGITPFSGTYWMEKERSAQDDLLIIDGILYDGTACSGKVVIPETVSIIAGAAFADNANITSVQLPESVKIIGERAFADCKDLEKLTFSDGLTIIGEGAFAGCINLWSVILPDTVTTLGAEAFAGCSELSALNLSEKMTTIAEGTFRDCESLTQLTIPVNIKSIEKSAFIGCKRLSIVRFSENTTSIHDTAFNHADDFTLKCQDNSVAKEYAREWKHSYLIESPSVYQIDKHAFDNNLFTADGLNQSDFKKYKDKYYYNNQTSIQVFDQNLQLSADQLFDLSVKEEEDFLTGWNGTTYRITSNAVVEIRNRNDQLIAKMEQCKDTGVTLDGARLVQQIRDLLLYESKLYFIVEENYWCDVVYPEGSIVLSTIYLEYSLSTLCAYDLETGKLEAIDLEGNPYRIFLAEHGLVCLSLNERLNVRQSEEFLVWYDDFETGKLSLIGTQIYTPTQGIYNNYFDYRWTGPSWLRLVDRINYCFKCSIYESDFPYSDWVNHVLTDRYIYHSWGSLSSNELGRGISLADLDTLEEKIVLECPVHIDRFLGVKGENPIALIYNDGYQVVELDAASIEKGEFKYTVLIDHIQMLENKKSPYYRYYYVDGEIICRDSKSGSWLRLK